MIQEALTEVRNAISAALVDWNVTLTADGFPNDKDLDVVMLDFTKRYVEIGTAAYVGRVAFVTYRKWNVPYLTYIDEVESITETIENLSVGNAIIGANTNTVAEVSAPSVAKTVSGDTLRVLQIIMPIEIGG